MGAGKGERRRGGEPGDAGGHDNTVIAVRTPRVQSAPLVFASPHSGTDYDPAFVAASRLDERSLRRSEDSFVDEIFARVPSCGAPLLCALFPRAYLDPNREPYELDPEMFSDALPPFVKTRTDRVRAGFGTIARVVATGSEIYRAKLCFADAESHIQALYRPYHRTLERLIDETMARFGAAILIDCHSMPSVGGPTDRDRGKRRADIVLGDRFGTSCAPAVTDLASEILSSLGLSVAQNNPYAGAHTTAHYGRPAEARHALQIEVNRALYMNETAFTRSKALPALAETFGAFVTRMAEIDLSLLCTG